jgi:hypothetical protein
MPRRLSGHTAGWLIPLALALLCAAAFAQDSHPSDSPVTQWENLIPQIRESLPRPCPDLNWEVKILDAAEIPSGGPSYAVVDYCDNAPSSDSVLIMQLQAGKPALARFRDAHKKLIDPAFLQAASVTEFADVRLTLDRTASTAASPLTSGTPPPAPSTTTPAAPEKPPTANAASKSIPDHA